MDFSPEQIRWIIQALIILVLSICVHEWGHAIMADKLGDPLPRRQGRVTLNPTKHADPIGTLVFPLMGLLITRGGSMGFGWGKPVMTQPHAYTRRFSMRTGHMFVAAAGPLMNVAMALVIAITHVLLVKFGVIDGGPLQNRGGNPETLNQVLYWAARLNFILFFFNLIPAPPLDGGAVLEGLLPRSMLEGYSKYKVYGPFVLMAVIFIPQIAMVFIRPAMWCSETLYSTLGSLLL